MNINPTFKLGMLCGSLIEKFNPESRSYCSVSLEDYLNYTNNLIDAFMINSNDLNIEIVHYIMSIYHQNCEIIDNKIECKNKYIKLIEGKFNKKYLQLSG